MNNATLSEPRTVVIGGGLAGLTAATYLARAGASVTVLEKAPTLGGRAATDTPETGFALNRGAHALYTGGAASEVLRELGITYTHGSPRGVLARDETGLHPFPATPLDMLRTSLLTAGDKAELLRVFARLSTLRPEPLVRTSTAEWIAANVHRPSVRRVVEALARVSLYTSALDLVSADVFAARFQQVLTHPIHYIDGGWQTLVDKLRREAVRAGARVLTSASAAEVQVHGGRAAGVALHDGGFLECTSVIVATPPEDAARLLPEWVSPQPGTGLTPVHIACLDLGLRCLPSPRHAVIIDLEQPRFVTAQSEFARVAPSGGAVVHAFRYLDPRQAGDPPRERAELEALLDQAQPGWRELVVEERFLPRMLGVGALPLAASGGLAGRPAHRCADVDNLFFAGDWVGPDGFLVDAALASARASARLVLSHQRQPTLRTAVAA